MAISNLVLTQQIYSEETNGAHAHYREPVPLMLNLFLNLSSHPLDAVNSESPSSSLAHLAFSCNIGPVTGMFLILALWYHSYIASSIFCVCDALAGLESAFLFALYSSSISVLLAK